LIRGESPSFIDSAIGSTNAQLSAQLGIGMIRDFQSASVFHIFYAESPIIVSGELPFLVCTLIIFPDNQLIWMIVILA